MGGRLIGRVIGFTHRATRTHDLAVRVALTVTEEFYSSGVRLYACESGGHLTLVTLV